MLDLHSHILPGVDDGAASLEDALEIARAAAEDGTQGIAATPHVRGDYPTTAERMQAGVAELEAAIGAEGIPLQIYPGGEIALDRLGSLAPDELRRFGLAGSRYVLLEFPYQGWPLDLGQRLFELEMLGLVPVLAHPERSAEVRAAPKRLAPLVDGGALVQVTAASLDGRLGSRTRATALELVESGLAHLIASDAHSAEVREVGMRDAAAAVGGPLAVWLTQEVPAAIVADAPLPPRPATAAKRRRWWR